MSPVQKVIKYFAMAFAILLSVGIITTIASVVLALTNGLSVSSHDTELASFTREFEKVKSIDINCEDIDVVIEAGDSFKVEAINVPVDYEVNLTKDGVLDLGYEEDEGWFSFSFHWFGNTENAKLTITIPTDAVLNNLNIDGGSGNLSLNGIITNNLIMDLGSGELKATKLIANSAQIDGDSGEQYFEKIVFSSIDMETGSGNSTMVEANLTNMNLDSGSGSVNIIGLLHGDTRIDCNSGNVTLQIDDYVDNFELECETGSGGIWIDGEKVGNNYYNRNTSAANRIEIDGGSGRVALDFK